MPEGNVLSSKRSRDENVIKHPQETYIEVSARSITKIRLYAAISKKNGRSTLCTIALSLWTTCLGAILGYLPGFFAIIQGKSSESLSKACFWIFALCIVAFIVWRILCSKSNHSLSQLIEIIEDELSEDRVPVNSSLIPKDMTTRNIMKQGDSRNSPSYETAKMAGRGK